MAVLRLWMVASGGRGAGVAEVAREVGVSTPGGRRQTVFGRAAGDGEVAAAAAAAGAGGAGDGAVAAAGGAESVAAASPPVPRSGGSGSG